MLRPIPRPPCVCGPAGLLAGDVSGFGRASSAQATQSPQSDGGGVFFSFYFHNFHLSAGRPALCLVFDFVDDRRGLFPRPDIATDLVDYRSGRVQRPDLATSHGDYRSGRFPCPDFAPALVDYRRGRVPRRDFAPGHVDEWGGRAPRRDIAPALENNRSGRAKRPDQASGHGYDWGGLAVGPHLPPGHGYDHSFSGADNLDHIIAVADSILSWVFNFHIIFSFSC